MDPLSITVSCVSLLSNVSKTTIELGNFMRGCRDARSDLLEITKDLSQLTTVLRLVRDDIEETDERIIPKPTRDKVFSIIIECSTVVHRIDNVLQSYSGKTGSVKWATGYRKEELEGIRSSLKDHCDSLNTMLDLVGLAYSKAIKEDTSAVRADVGHIKEDTSRILEELRSIKGRIAQSSGIEDRFIPQVSVDYIPPYAGLIGDSNEYQDNGQEEEEQYYYSSSESEDAYPYGNFQQDTGEDAELGWEDVDSDDEDEGIPGPAQRPNQVNPINPQPCQCSDCQPSSSLMPPTQPLEQRSTTTTPPMDKNRAPEMELSAPLNKSPSCDCEKCRLSKMTLEEPAKTIPQRGPPPQQLGFVVPMSEPPPSFIVPIRSPPTRSQQNIPKTTKDCQCEECQTSKTVLNHSAEAIPPWTTQGDRSFLAAPLSGIRQVRSQENITNSASEGCQCEECLGSSRRNAGAESPSSRGHRGADSPVEDCQKTFTNPSGSSFSRKPSPMPDPKPKNCDCEDCRRSSAPIPKQSFPTPDTKKTPNCDCEDCRRSPVPIAKEPSTKLSPQPSNNRLAVDEYYETSTKPANCICEDCRRSSGGPKQSSTTSCSPAGARQTEQKEKATQAGQCQCDDCQRPPSSDGEYPPSIPTSPVMEDTEDDIFAQASHRQFQGQQGTSNNTRQLGLSTK